MRDTEPNTPISSPTTDAADEDSISPRDRVRRGVTLLSQMSEAQLVRIRAMKSAAEETMRIVGKSGNATSIKA